MELEKTKIEYKEIVDLLDEHYTLHYTDYRDNLNEHLDLIQQAISENSPECIDEKIWDWWIDDFYWEDSVFDELKDNIVKKFDIDEDEAEELIEENKDDLRSEIEGRDDSDLYKSLLDNTSDQTFFYDTGYIFEGFDGNREGELREVKRILGIKGKHYDNRISMMLAQAGYGGQLVIYFYDGVDRWIETDEKLNTIEFRNPFIAVINVGNGSGDHTELGGLTIELPFDKANLFLCKTIKYSYTFDVCGMYSNWCAGTDVTLKTKKKKAKAVKSRINEHNKQEKQYQKTYNEGKCTYGDMDIKRHRNTYYLNEYPCGTHCKICGTFWID